MGVRRRCLNFDYEDAPRDKELHDKKVSLAIARQKTKVTQKREARRVVRIQAARDLQKPKIIHTGLGIVPRPRFTLTARY